jgi:predicted O-methyltransferase YrrM
MMSVQWASPRRRETKESDVMHEMVEEVFRTGTVKTRDGQTIKVHSHIPRDECELLYRMVLEIKATRAIEVGLAYGISSLCICDALRHVASNGSGAQPRYVGMDPSQSTGWKGVGLNHLNAAGFDDMVEFHERSSQAVLPQLAAEGRRFDFAFIDGWHTFDHALIDFFYIDQMLEIGGIIVFDDVGYAAINGVLRFVLSNRSYELVDALTQYQLPARLKAKLFVKRILRRLARTNRDAAPSDQKTFDRLMAKHCAAVRKNGNDDRRWDHFRPFS